jgi:hypothetical protein
MIEAQGLGKKNKRNKKRRVFYGSIVLHAGHF